MSSKNIKTAQFGGVGGGGNGAPFAPGKSPIGSGGKNPGGGDINVNWDENDTLNKLIEKTHIDQDTSDRNIEARITPFHSNFEENKVYILDPTQRLKEQNRAKLHNLKQSLENYANKANQKYTTDPPKKEHARTMEESLFEKRHFDDTQKRNFDYEDKVPDQIKPTRIHPVLSDTQLNRIAIIVMRDKLTEENDPDVEQRNIFDKKRYTDPPIGRTPVLDVDLDQYFKDMKHEYTPQEDGFMEEGDIVSDMEQPDTKANVHPRQDMGVPLEDKNVNTLNLNKGIEANLHPIKAPNNQLSRNQMADEEDKLGKESLGPEDQGYSWLGVHSPNSFGA